MKPSESKNRNLKETVTRETISENEKRYRVLFDSMLLGVFYQGTDGRITDVNPAALKMFELTKEEFLSRTFYDEEWELIKEDGSFFKPEEFPSMVALLSGKPVIDTSIGVYNHHLNQYTWLIVNAIPEFRANEESPYHAIVIIYDVTERRYAEEDIKIKEALFRELFDNMKSGSAIFTVINDGSKGSDYIIKKINNSGLKMDGKTLEEVVGKRFIDLRPSIDSYGLIPVMKKVWETGEAVLFPSKLYKDENCSNYYENYVFKLPSGEVVTLYDDVTESVRAGDALLDSEERYRRLVEGSPYSIAVHSEGKFIYVNPAGVKLVGARSQSELIGKPILDIVHPDSRSRVVERIGHLEDGKDAPVFEEKFVKFDGSSINVEVVGIPFNYRGQLATQVVVRDITERKKAEDNIKRDILFKAALLDISRAFLSPASDIVAVAKLVLEKAMQLTQSSHGFVSEINMLTGDNIGHAMTEMSGKECNITAENHSIVFRKGNGGYNALYGHSLNTGEAFYTNSPQTHSAYKNSTPEGHIPITGFLSVPAIIDNHIIGQIALANPKENYTQIDLDFVQSLANIYSIAIDRKRAENKLTESEKHYHTLFNAIDEGFCIIEMIFDENEKPVDYRFLEVNPAFSRQTVLIDAQGKRMRELNPEHEEYWFEIFGKIAVTGQPARFVNKAGPLHHWYDVYAFRVGKPEDRQVAFLFNDINERKQDTEILRLSQERLDLALRSAEMGVWYYNIKHKKRTFDEYSYRLLGIDPATFKGTDNEFFKVIHPGDREKVRKALDKSISFRVPYSSEYRVVHKDGTIYHISTRGNIVPSPDMKPEGIMGIVWDVTERKLSEDKLKKSEASLRRSAEELRALSIHLGDVLEKERTQIARDLHDDLGQKLTALNLNISWIKSRIGVQSRSVKNKIRDMLSLLNEAVENINKISHRLRPRILDDLGLRAAIEWQLSDLSKSTGISYNVSFVPENIIIDQDISLTIFRIIQESLTNVVRHSNATKVSLHFFARANYLKLVISDNGTGIEQDKVINPKSFGLLGMRERAGVYGGEFRIKGVKGKGTVVTVKIPLGK